MYVSTYHIEKCNVMFVVLSQLTNRHRMGGVSKLITNWKYPPTASVKEQTQTMEIEYEKTATNKL